MIEFEESALNAAVVSVTLDTGGKPPPQWIQLLPAGPNIQGADGRAWTLKEPASLVAAFQQRLTPLVIDWEHASEHRAPQGLDAPAAGWIHQLDVRDGQIWGRAEWTARAASQIQGKEYRYLSPVFSYRKDSREIVALTSAGLTNQPNLPLTALNRVATPAYLPAADQPLWEAAQRTIAQVPRIRRAFGTADAFFHHLQKSKDN